MKRRPVLLGVLVMSVLGGCMSTRHVEQSYNATTGVDSTGSPYVSQQATHAERQWRGPWLGQPDTVHP